MSRLVNVAGTVVFWLAWPVIHVLLLRGSRTRVLVRVNDEVLLLKSVLGNGKWTLPGGGLKRNETPSKGAIREVKEEVGITISEKRLRYQGKFVGSNSEKHRYTYHLFTVRLTEKPALRVRRHELREAAWLDYKKASQDSAVGKIARDMIARCT